MKKLFVSPVVEVKSLSPETEVMGLFSAATSVESTSSSSVLVVKDEKSNPDNAFSYWSAK